ncbi:MAG: sirohydrochlorin cobalto/nickelchelatase [Methanolobus sp.]|jgi:sirohydrochlorin cobaltochelatase|nr:sirohydrochlorin cobalto/nickelchelatase [Methanolobus sp.]MDK2911389.1 sirohydrochlorin cobalto/nickelchelatase [Methanolobus sp.]MDN5309990.1 sirohydrochlorin cobalto/nickelchelatase [Methanolobus sp.]
MTEKIGILAIGHGSRLPYNNQVVSEIADMIAKKHPEYVVKSGFMEMSTPSVEEALLSFTGTGVTKIAAVPVFLASGVHITKDIPEILKLDPETKQGKVKLDGKEVTIVYGKPLGSDELIADLIFKRAQEVI